MNAAEFDASVSAYIRKQIALGEAQAEAEIALDDARKMPPPSREWRRCFNCGGTGFCDSGYAGYEAQQQRCGICSGAGRVECEVRRAP